MLRLSGMLSPEGNAKLQKKKTSPPFHFHFYSGNERFFGGGGIWRYMQQAGERYMEVYAAQSAKHFDAGLGVPMLVEEIELPVENPDAARLVGGENGFVFFNFRLLVSGQLDTLQVCGLVV